ncbi:MAG: hypothetical protein ICV70_06115 [Jiangellaceae bacterium]|nr:hypothetical protein [Jiangellaceae bacterium]
MSRHHDEHDRGLSHDLPTLLSRRRTLALLGGAGLAVLSAACASDGGTASSGRSSPDDGAPSATPPDVPGSVPESTVEVGDGEMPEETTGPYPADGSNGVNVLTESGIVRSDLTRSFGTASGVADGVPVTVDLTVLDVSGGTGSPLGGAAVYLWHCTRDGEYSLYSSNIADENYLRGVQATDAAGRLTFSTIFPGAYSGRWPHMHFEVYPSLSAATTASSKLRTSQLALPEDACRLVYATEGYERSLRNLEQTSLDSDNVFSDGYSLQLASVSGSVDGGMTATLTVPV